MRVLEVRNAERIESIISQAAERGITDAAIYVADGSNRWPAVHTLDAARAYRLALEAAPARSRLHAVADDGVPFRDGQPPLQPPPHQQSPRSLAGRF